MFVSCGNEIKRMILIDLNVDKLVDHKCVFHHTLGYLIILIASSIYTKYSVVQYATVTFYFPLR